MSDIDELRRQFYDDEESDPYAFAAGSGSGSSSRTRGGASSSTALRTSSPRVRPYPPRTSSTAAEGSAGQPGRGAGRQAGAAPRTRGKERDMPSLARARAAPIGDDEFWMQFAGGHVPDAGTGDAMDVDSNHASSADDALSSGTHGKENLIQQLLRAWQNERHAPDILPACDELLGRVLDLIRRQIRITETLRNADVTLSEEDHYCTTLVQTEVERVKFVVRSYVRTRLYKIEQYSAYITLTPDIHPRLTRAELRHAQRYGELVVSHFTTTVLGHLPETQRGLADDNMVAVPSIVSEPDKNKPVFFHAFDAIEGLQLDDGTSESIPKDTIMLLPYHVIEQHLLRGEGELV